MEHTAFTFENVNNVLERVDYTDKLTVSSGTYSGEACTMLTIPFDTTNTLRYVSSYHIENLSASHEYNLKFKASCSVLTSVGTTVLGVYLVFYNGDTILKEQELGSCEFNSLGWQKVDFDFKPDASGLGGYKTRLEFRFVSVTSAAVIYRLSDIIEFTDKDDNSGWFQKIINAIKEIPEKIGDLRDNISNYFSALGDRITAKFESVGTSITNKFEEVKNAIGSWFTEIGDKLSNKFAEVGNAITSKFAEIGAEFSATFDTFKPRFYEQFNWTYGIYSDSGYETFPKEDDIGFAVISEPFVVPQGTTYKLSLTFSDLFTSDKGSQYVFQIYDIGSGGVIADEFVDYAIAFNYEWELVPGNAYVFTLSHAGYESFDSVFPGISLNDICNSVVKVYADEGWLTAFGRMILNGLKNFFIPSSDYFDTYSETTKTWAAEHFGFLYTAADLFSSVVENLKGLLRDDYSFKIPPAKFTLMGTEYTLWEEYEVPVKEYLQNSALNFAYNTYLVMLSGALAFALLEYARKTYDKVMAN